MARRHRSDGAGEPVTTKFDSAEYLIVLPSPRLLINFHRANAARGASISCREGRDLRFARGLTRQSSRLEKLGILPQRV